VGGGGGVIRGGSETGAKERGEGGGVSRNREKEWFIGNVRLGRVKGRGVVSARGRRRGGRGLLQGKTPTEEKQKKP